MDRYAGGREAAGPAPARRASRFLRRRAIALGCAAATALGPSVGARAAADEGGEPIALDYDAPAGCPDLSAFVTRIRARTSRARMAWPGEPARSFRVKVVAGPPARGTITVSDEHATEGARALEAASCTEVVDGLALITALAIDPEARTSPVLSPAPSSASASSAAPALSPAPPLPRPASTISVPPPPSSSAPEDEPARSAPETTAPAHPSSLSLAGRFGIGASAAVASGVGPLVLFGASPFLEARPLLGDRLDLGIAASFVRADSGTTAVTSGTADFTWTVGRIDACALLHVLPRLDVGPCARAEGASWR